MLRYLSEFIYFIIFVVEIKFQLRHPFILMQSISPMEIVIMRH